MVAFLLLTLAPFALIGPLLGSIFHRVPRSHRAGLGFGSLGRVVLVVAMIRSDSGFVLLSSSSGYWCSPASSGSAAVPYSPPRCPSRPPWYRPMPGWRGWGSSPLGWQSRGGGTDRPARNHVRARPGRRGLRLVGGGGSGTAARCTCDETPSDPGHAAPARSPASRRAVRHARIATAIVRLLNGYLLLLVAFVFRDSEESMVSFGALLLAAGLGFGLASYLAQFLAPPPPRGTDGGSGPGPGGGPRPS